MEDLVGGVLDIGRKMVETITRPRVNQISKQW